MKQRSFLICEDDMDKSMDICFKHVSALWHTAAAQTRRMDGRQRSLALVVEANDKRFWIAADDLPSTLAEDLTCPNNI
jgi:hypothetical protein